MESKFWELLVVLAIVVLLFGPGRLAGFGGAVGKAVRGFRDAMRSEEPQPRPSPTAGEAHKEAPPR